MELNGKRILCCLADRLGCGQYRIINPYSYLHKKYGTDVCITMIFREEDIINYDIIVLQRQYSPEIIASIKKIKQEHPHIKFIYEVDDYFHNLPSYNPCGKYYPKESDRLDNIINFIEICDALTVTTETLKQLYGKYNKNVHVIPNYIYDHDFPKDIIKDPKDDENDIVIFWAGSSTHKEDLRVVTNPLTKLFEEDKRLKLYLMGCDYTNLFPGISYSRKKYIKGTLPNKEEYLKTIQELLDQHEGNINFLETLTKDNKYNAVQQYYELFAKLDIDIAIAPLEDNEFNRSKSFIKLEEYTAFNIPYVASAVTPYINYNQHIDFYKAKKNSCGLIASNDGEWKKCLKYMIDNKDEFKARQKEKYKEIILENNIEKYKEMLERVMENEISKEIS